MVDNNNFSIDADSSLKKKKKQLLCVARFSLEKNLIELIGAFKASKLSRKDWELKLIGGGPLKNELEVMIKDSPVFLQEWQSYENLPAIYREASLFILPSIFEPWGLVVNEAMAASLPIIVSTEVGCMPDLLIPEENGWSFVPGDKENICALFNAVSIVDDAKLDLMGKNSRRIIENFTTSVFSSNLKSLIES